MSFLDNLESNLKSLETREEARDARALQNRDKDRAQALAVAPWAEKLKQSAFTQELLRHVTRMGHAMRTKVRISWIGSTLRLEAAEQRLELRPTTTGITAVFTGEQKEPQSQPVDLEGSAEALARQWLG
jgi:hypothetical protein